MTSNIVNIYKNEGIEFINYGSLYGNITIEDALAGLSTSRNPYLQSIFMRLKRVEAIGSGLKRVNSYYVSRNLSMNINVLPASFVVKLPRINEVNNSKVSDNELIMEHINEFGTITRSEAQEIIGKWKTTTASILNEMVNKNRIKVIGNGPSIRYIKR